MQELTGLRILAIHGTDALSVPVPPWEPDASTPLHAVPTLGQRVRAWRRAHRRVQLHHERAAADRLIAERQASTTDLAAAYSEPYWAPEPAAGAYGDSAGPGVEHGAGAEVAPAAEELHTPRAASESVPDETDQPAPLSTDEHAADDQTPRKPN